MRDNTMATRDTLIRVRRVIAEFKIYITRTQSYLAPLQLFMIFLIFLNTTVWNLDAVEAFFGSKMRLILTGSVFFLVCVLLIGYVDTKLRMFRAEQARYNNPERNPYVRLYPLWTALLLSEKRIERKKAEKIEKMLVPMMKETGIYEDYLKFKEK